MPWIKIGDSVIHIRTSGMPRQKFCFYCGKSSEFQCDYPVGKHKNGRKKACDRHLCFQCTQPGKSENVDFCKEHYPLAKAAYERKLAAGKVK